MTTAVAERSPALGAGIYSMAEAAQILGRGPEPVSSRQVRYWMSTGLTPCSYGDEGLLSFADLISLEVVRRFRTAHTSLQRIRVFEALLRERTGQDRPFAYRSFFTDGAELWAQRTEDDKVYGEQLTGRRDKNAGVLMPAVRTFASEIQYDAGTERALRWSVTKHVTIDPAVQFGSPCVTGTRVTVDTVSANLEVGSAAEVADWFGLTVAEVRGVKAYLRAA